MYSITTFSSREFNQDAARAKRAAAGGPVIITDRGRPSHVLLTMAEYQRIKGSQMSLAVALAQPAGLDLEFNPPRLGAGTFKAPDLS